MQLNFLPPCGIAACKQCSLVPLFSDVESRIKIIDTQFGHTCGRLKGKAEQYLMVLVRQTNDRDFGGNCSVYAGR